VGSAVANLQLGDHVCLPFDSDDERFAAFAEFTDAGVAGRFKVLLLTAAESAESLGGRLADRVASYRAASVAGQVEIVASQDRYLASGRFDGDRVISGYATATDTAQMQGYAGLWVNVDMAWALDEPGFESVIDYEIDANTLFSSARMAAVCQYDRRLFDRETVAGVCSAHPIIDGGAAFHFNVIEDPPGLVLTGELDGTNQRALATVLAPLSRVQTALTIDAAGVSFAGVEAAAMLVRLADRRRGFATTIVCQAQLGRLLRMLDPTRALVVRAPAQERGNGQSSHD
jgi:hypothetical protein